MKTITPSTQDDRRAAMMALQEHALAQPQVEIPIEHHHAHGQYARTMHAKAGLLIIGKIHKISHVCVLSAGECTFVDMDGTKQRVSAPHIWVAAAGAKRAIITHTDITWTCVHHTWETEVEKCVADVIAPDFDTFDQLLAEKAMQCLT